MLVVGLVHPQERRREAVGESEGSDEQESLVGGRDFGDIPPEECQEGGHASAVSLASSVEVCGAEVGLPSVFGGHGLYPERSVLLDVVVQNTVEDHSRDYLQMQAAN